MEIVPPFKNYVVRKMSEVMAETKLQGKTLKTVWELSNSK